ncbi:unnamed protein product, partial [Ectocarpus sp. 12 AP-2014]
LNITLAHHQETTTRTHPYRAPLSQPAEEPQKSEKKHDYPRRTVLYPQRWTVTASVTALFDDSEKNKQEQKKRRHTRHHKTKRDQTELLCPVGHALVISKHTPTALRGGSLYPEPSRAVQASPAPSAAPTAADAGLENPFLLFRRPSPRLPVQPRPMQD